LTDFLIYRICHKVPRPRDSNVTLGFSSYATINLLSTYVTTQSRAVASPTQLGWGGRKNFRWCQIFIIFFKVWSEK